MEFLTIFLSSLITLVSPTGFVVDRVALSTIRSQFKAVEQLAVRVDNAPSYQVLQGKADRIRMAGRGVFPARDVRLAVLEVETDPIHLNPQRLRRGKPQLLEPLRAGVHLVLTQADINRALRSPAIVNDLRRIGLRRLPERDARQVRRYALLNPEVTILPDQRLRIQADLQEGKDPATLRIVAETGLTVVAGRQVRLVAPFVRLNGEPVPARLVQSIAAGIERESDLRQFEKSGITARVLQLQLTDRQIDVATFVQITPVNALTPAGAKASASPTHP